MELKRPLRSRCGLGASRNVPGVDLERIGEGGRGHESIFKGGEAVARLKTEKHAIFNIFLSHDYDLMQEGSRRSAV